MDRLFAVNLNDSLDTNRQFLQRLWNHSGVQKKFDCLRDSMQRLPDPEMTLEEFLTLEKGHQAIFQA